LPLIAFCSYFGLFFFMIVHFLYFFNADPDFFVVILDGTHSSDTILNINFQTFSRLCVAIHYIFENEAENNI